MFSSLPLGFNVCLDCCGIFKFVKERFGMYEWEICFQRGDGHDCDMLKPYIRPFRYPRVEQRALLACTSPQTETIIQNALQEGVQCVHCAVGVLYI